MNEIEAKQQAAQRALIPGRLLKGAEILGRLWREGKRCVSGWNSICQCDLRNDFCVVKLKWVEMAEDLRPAAEILIGRPMPFKVIELMTLRELAATGLTVELEWNGMKMKVGPRGTGWETLRSIVELPVDGQREGWAVAARAVAAFSS